MTGAAPADPRVVIVGAGPAGLLLAWILHRAGVAALLVERTSRAALGQEPKAGVLEHRTVRLLEREGVRGPVVAIDDENGRCEFRTPDTAVVVDYGALTGDRPHAILPQHVLVARLAGALIDAGAPLWFSHRVGAIVPGPDAVSVTVTGPDGAERVLAPEFLIGCDGAGSVVARAMDGVTVENRVLPGRWLVVSAATPPLVGHTIYAAHPRGFAGHVRRGPAETRFYLEIPGSESAADWPHDRLRTELAARLGVGDALDGVVFPAVDTLDLRTRVTTPMQQGRLFLAGDAAHLITPAGGKGMNLALADAAELAHGLIARCGAEADPGRLERYSAARLPDVWRTQAFSDWLLRLLSAGSAGRPADRFTDGLREGWVSALEHDPMLARWFAHAYAGVDAGAAADGP